MWYFLIRPSNSQTLKDTGPVWSNMVPSSHVGDPEKFWTNTWSPIWKALAREWLSRIHFCLSWFSCTLPDTSGWSKSSHDHGCLPNNSSAGERPVVVCGVSRYFDKNWDNLVSRVPPSSRLILCLKVCTAHSAKPFDGKEQFEYEQYNLHEGNSRTHHW